MIFNIYFSSQFVMHKSFSYSGGFHSLNVICPFISSLDYFITYNKNFQVISFLICSTSCHTSENGISLPLSLLLSFFFIFKFYFHTVTLVLISSNGIGTEK